MICAIILRFILCSRALQNLLMEDDKPRRTFQTLPHVQRKGCRGCPTKHDSLWIVFNVFFHIMYYILLTFCSLFSFKNLLLKYILLWNQFYYNMADIENFIFFSWGSNNLTNYGRRHFKVFTNCHVSWDTNFKWPPI